MNVQVLGCSHHNTSISVRERLAFRPEQTRWALGNLRREFPRLEVVLLSTCNRVEFYTGTENGGPPTRRQMAEFLGRFHGVDPAEVVEHLYEQVGREAIRHLFMVASSLDSMVVGEPQIISQVKQAYQLAAQQDATGPLTHAAFQAALKIARRVAGETAIHRHRVSIPSVAVADLHHRAVGPLIKRLRQGWQGPKENELQRLFNKLSELDDRHRGEIRRSFDRLVNKLLHPPLESLRAESRHGIPNALLDALGKLFQLKD